MTEDNGSDENGNDATEENSEEADADSQENNAEPADDPSDRYERTEELGSGGLGTVYKATQHRLDRAVAIKEVRNIFEVFADLDREEIVERFAEVTKAQASLAHPNVARVFDLETDEEYPYAVTEFADAGTLRRFIDHEDRSLRAALKYFLQVLGALSTAHEADLVHGGIKPENILIDNAGNAVVTDFGHSGVVDVSEGSNQVYVGVGTVNYMPPEQFEDPTASTEASDIYSAGIMFYEMLTGKVPGRRSPMPSSVHPSIPTAIDDIFDDMTMDRVEDRFESVDSVLNAIYKSDEILDLLDRRSAVLFQHDPVDDDAPFGDDGSIILGGEQPEAEDAKSDDASSDQSTSNADQRGDVIERDGGDGSDDGPDPASSQQAEESADDEEANEEQSEPQEARLDEESTPANENSASDAEQDQREELDEDEVDEEDEVLDKLEDYGELFDED